MNEASKVIATARATAGSVVMTIAVSALLGASACSTMPADARHAVIDNHKVAFRILGSGKPVVVMISGLGDGMATFQDVATDISKSATVIIYDRAGYGGSDALSGARDARAAERELAGLLAQSGVPGPYVLAGHSLGGLFAEYYAVRHPEQVAGMILEESRPADFSRRCEAAGISGCAPPVWITMFGPKGEQGEASALRTTEAEVEAAGAVKSKPVLLLSRPVEAGAQGFDAMWATGQNDLAARYPGSHHLTASAGGHYIHVDQRAWYVRSVQAFLADVP